MSWSSCSSSSAGQSFSDGLWSNSQLYDSDEPDDRSVSESIRWSPYHRSEEHLPNHMRPASIRFCQDSILSEFRNGIPLEDVIDELLRGELFVEDFPPIRVFLRDGTDIDGEIQGDINLSTDTYSLDNRRLFVFQKFAERSYDEAPLVLLVVRKSMCKSCLIYGSCTVQQHGTSPF